MSGTLHVISTPLGNAGDMTLRAIDIFKALSTFVAEDTREIKKLFNLLKISLQDKQFFSYADHNMKGQTQRTIDLLLKGTDVGLVSDRGTPGISDPGAMLVEACWKNSIPVVPAPGVSAVSTLFSLSGDAEGRFFFYGFYPQTEKEKNKLWASVGKEPIVFYESPHRIEKTLASLFEKFPKAKIFIGREMTKTFEQYLWVESLADFSARCQLQGEFTFLFYSNVDLKDATDELEKEIALRAMPEKQWAKETAKKHSASSSDIYDALQKMKKISQFTDK